ISPTAPIRRSMASPNLHLPTVPGALMLQQPDADSPATSTYDPVSERLLRARTIVISGEITQKLAATVSGQLLALAAESDADITVFLNSQGGHVEAGDTITTCCG